MRHRRRTMIALRARRQALEIATKVAHPHVEQPLQVLAVDAPPEERPSLIASQRFAPVRELFSAATIIAVSVAAFVLIWYRLTWPY